MYLVLRRIKKVEKIRDGRAFDPYVPKNCFFSGTRLRSLCFVCVYVATLIMRYPGQMGNDSLLYIARCPSFRRRCRYSDVVHCSDNLFLKLLEALFSPFSCLSVHLSVFGCQPVSLPGICPLHRDKHAGEWGTRAQVGRKKIYAGY